MLHFIQQGEGQVENCWRNPNEQIQLALNRFNEAILSAHANRLLLEEFYQYCLASKTRGYDRACANRVEWRDEGKDETTEGGKRRDDDMIYLYSGLE